MKKASRPVIQHLEQRQLLSATLSVSNSLLVFNAVQNSSTSATETLTLTDTGDAPLTLGSGAFALANDPSSATQDASLFTLVNAGSAPATLAPGASFGLQLNYNANAIVTNKAFLEISTNDPVNPSVEVSLHGIGTRGLGGSNQPSLATILQAYNIPTHVGEGPNDANAATDSVYPNPPDSSSQEVVMQRFVKAGAGPISINVLASFTASGFTKSYTLGTYTPGEPTTLNELFYTTASENQTTYVQPQGTTSFDPGSNAFGFYFVSNVQVKGRVGYSEDALNTWDTTNPRKMRFFPMENPDGSVVPNTYIMTSTEWNAPIGYDFTNIVAVVSNITAAPGAPAAPVMGLQNLNAVPGSNTMVFSRIQSQNTKIGDTVHDTGVLQINNTGKSALVISSYSLSANWSLVSPPTFPVTVSAGAHLDLSIKFTASALPAVPYNETNSDFYPNGGGVYDGSLVLNSNDPNNSSATVPLRGYWQSQSENSMEPGFMTLANLMFNWDTYINSHPITTLYETDSVPSSPNYFGEEVVSGYWQQADASANVVVQQIAAFHTQGNTGTTNYFLQGHSNSPTKLFETAADDGQTIFPNAINTTTPASGSFSTTGTFGFRVDNEYSDDALNSLQTGGGHHFRFYPVRDGVGNLIPNTYIMTMDYSNTPENFDFQDNVYVVSNIRPAVVNSSLGLPQTAGGPPAPTDFTALSSNGVNTLQWAPILYTNTAGYYVYRSTSINGTYTRISTNVITGDTYTDTTAPPTGTAYYQVKAIDSATSAHSLGATASVINTGTPTSGNGAPVAAAQTVTTSAGVAVTVNVVATATDNTNGTIQASTVTVTTNPLHGAASVDSTTGIITYTPAAGFTGADTFQYTIGDTTGAVSAPATVTINVSSVPVGAPVAANLSIAVLENTVRTIAVAGSATDTSATINPASVVITLAPAHGIATLDPVTGNILYTPATNYLGGDTIKYTISDSLAAVSQEAVITLSVSRTAPPGPVASTVTATASTTGTSSTIDVLSSVNDATGNISASGVTITALPSHGTATINASTGAIVYTANTGFVGSDTLQYTVADNHGLVSAPATVSLSVGVTINNSTARSLVFVDAAGSKVTISLTGGGSAQLSFAGTGTAQMIPGPHGTGNVVVSGTGLGLSNITVTGSTVASALNISRRSASSVPVTGIAVAGAIGKINAPTTVFSGILTIGGAVNSIQFAGISAADITVGSFGSRTGFTTLTTGHVSDTMLTSALPLRSVRVIDWMSTSTAGSITAPSIASLVTTGDFQAGITTSGGSPFSLGTVHIGGQAGADHWNITGAAANILIDAMAPGFTGTFSSSINSFAIRSDGFSGRLTAGNINSLSIVGDDTGHITAASIRSARVIGQLNGANITLTNGVTPRVNSLGHLQVTGATLSSQINSAGNIGSISTAGISGSSVDAGIASGISLPDIASDFTASAMISSFAVTGRGNTFADTNIAAQTIGNLSLGTITTSNGNTAFGIAGGTIGSLSAALDNGGSLRMNRTVLASSDSIATYLSDKSLSLGAFVIRPGLDHSH